MREAGKIYTVKRLREEESNERIYKKHEARIEIAFAFVSSDQAREA